LANRAQASATFHFVFVHVDGVGPSGFGFGCEIICQSATFVAAAASPVVSAAALPMQHVACGDRKVSNVLDTDSQCVNVATVFLRWQV
jgi:hypothetical protein